MGINNRQKIMWLSIAVFGIIPVIWIAVLIAPLFSSETLRGMKGLLYILDHPWTPVLTKGTLPTVLIMLALYLFAAYAFFEIKLDVNLKPGAEHGDARWADPKKVGKELSDKNGTRNIVLTKNVSVYCDDRVTGINIIVLVLGSPGSGKSRFVVIPTLLNMLGSYIIIDPKGELLEYTGKMYEEAGYDIKIFNLRDATNSHLYNPFHYIRRDRDLDNVVTNLFRCTTPKGTNNQDPFFEQMAETLLRALMFAVYYEAPEEEMNFDTVLFILGSIQVSETNEKQKSWVHVWFEKLEKRNPYHPAIGPWKACMQGAARTVKSIIISLQAHLKIFDSEEVRALTCMDNIELDQVGERKTALFLELSEQDTAYNAVVSLMYTSLFSELTRIADTVHRKDGCRLPEYTLFVMDEMANVPVPENFPNLVATLRSRNIGFMMFLQDINQLETTFKDYAKTIIGCADQTLYLGSNSKDTMKLISEMLGEQTIDIQTTGQTTGQSSSSSKNMQKGGLPLASVSQIRRMPLNKCILMIKSKDGIYDSKYDPRKHPRANLTPLLGDNTRKYNPTIGYVSTKSETINEHSKDNAYNKFYVTANKEGYRIIDYSSVKEFYEQRTEKLFLYESQEAFLMERRAKRAEKEQRMEDVIKPG